MKKVLATILAFASLNAVSLFVMADDEDALVIWTPRGMVHMETIGQKFEQETGIPVKVESPSESEKQFLVTAGAGKGPDILLWAHDRYGEWVNGGLLAEIKPSKAMRNANTDIARDAMKVNGKTYGYPIAVEAVSLIYNTDLVPNPPSSFEDIFQLDQQLQSQNKRALLWDYNNTYFTFPLLAANGGYAFAHTAGKYDVANIGVNNAGAIQGAELVAKMVKEGLMPKGADYAIMEAQFSKQEVAMMINGPWSWTNIEKAKVNYAVVPLPTLGGQPAKPFVGVFGAVINASSKNQAAAVEFLESYLLTVDGLKTFNTDRELGAVANKELMKELATDANVAATYNSALNGIIMPNIPEMNQFWTAMATALQNITSGRQAVKEALDSAAKRMM